MRTRVFSLIPLLLVFAAFAYAEEWNKTYVVSGTPELRPRMSPVPREHVASDGPTRIFLVHAHTRDVSSTMIRERLAGGQSIDELVPPAVARHIHKHHLYGAVNSLHDEDERL